MGDFRTQTLLKAIPTVTGAGVLSAQAPADFTALDSFDRGLLIPCCTHNTGGIGTITTVFDSGLQQNLATIGFDDSDTITFTESYAANGRANQCGAQLLEYIGPGNGPNAMIMRADLTITLANGVTTVDSAAISGIANLAKCVPFGFSYSTSNTTDFRPRIVHIDVVNSGGNNVIRCTRTASGDTATVRVRLVEFIGSNWTIQKVAHTFSAAGTNEDATITAVAVANSFTYSTFLPPANTTALQSDLNYFVWLAGTTTLRHRVKHLSLSVNQACTTWVLTNPQMNVATYGTIDGTADYTATGGNPDTVNLTVTAVPDINQALVIGYAGSDVAGSLSPVSAWWLIDMTTTTNVRMRRSGHATAANRGDTEYFVQVIDLSGVASTRIDSVDTITDGAAFHINGLFSPGSTVTHGGDAVTVTNQTTSQLTCTGSVGTKAYGDAYPLVVTDSGGGSDLANVPIAPASGTRYANLSGNPASSGTRLTAVSDLTGVEQIRWLDADMTGVAMTGADIEVLANGVLRYHPAVTGASFAANRKDGGGWGAKGAQTFAQAVLAPPTINAPGNPDVSLFNTVSAQINVGQWGAGWSSVALIGTLPTGLTFNASTALITGAPSQLGVFPVTARYTNTDGNTDDAFVITVVDLPTSLTFRVNTQFLNDATPVPASAVFKNGEAFNRTTGAQYVANYPSDGKVVYQRGIGYRQDGAMLISTGGVEASRVRGLSVTTRGEINSTEADSTRSVAGKPVNDSGVLSVTDVN